MAFVNASFERKEMTSGLQSRPRGRGKTLDTYDIITVIYDMYDPFEYLALY